MKQKNEDEKVGQLYDEHVRYQKRLMPAQRRQLTPLRGPLFFIILLMLIGYLLYQLFFG